MLHLVVGLALALRPGGEAPEPVRSVRVVLLATPPAAGPPADAAPAPPVAQPVASEPPAAPRTPRRATPRPVAAPAQAAPQLAPEPERVGGAVSAPGSVASAPPAGGAEGTAGSGAGATADEIAAYVALVRGRLAAHKRYPPLARRRGIEGSVLVRLAIASNGSLSAVEAIGSAPALLAESALEAARRASPLPPPPRGALQIEVPIRFRMVE